MPHQFDFIESEALGFVDELAELLPELACLARVAARRGDGAGVLFAEGGEGAGGERLLFAAYFFHFANEIIAIDSRGKPGPPVANY